MGYPLAWFNTFRVICCVLNGCSVLPVILSVLSVRSVLSVGIFGIFGVLGFFEIFGFLGNFRKAWKDTARFRETQRQAIPKQALDDIF